MTNPLAQLLALCPLDGRYASQVHALQPYFSEFALIRARVIIELRWLIHLSQTPAIIELPSLSAENHAFIEKLIDDFDVEQALRIKKIEEKTKHDVKAVEYYLQECLSQHSELAKTINFIHFACTSEDINNLAYGLILREALQQILIPTMQSLITKFNELAKCFAAQPMLSRTHGQPATPTTVGKEFLNFSARLTIQLAKIQHMEIKGKMNGAVGNYNAHFVAYPNIDWPQISQTFVESLHLTFNPLTTQIEPHDYLVELFNAFAHFNLIVLDCDRDIWGYMALGYFHQQNLAGEIGSSTMPHKINPIDFENSEGNIGLSNALLDHFAHKLPCSRWQRDLSDSTVLRNIGTAFGYALLAYQATLKGLNKLQINSVQLVQDLEENWQVLAEAIQTVMRRYNLAEPYEQLKTLTRGKKITATELNAFIDQLDIPLAVRQELKKLTPLSYIGNACEQVKNNT